MTKLVFVVQEPDPKGDFNRVFWIEVSTQEESDSYGHINTYSYRMWCEEAFWTSRGIKETKRQGTISKQGFDSIVSVFVDALILIENY